MDHWTKYIGEYVEDPAKRAIVKGKIALNKRTPVKLKVNKYGEPVIHESNIPEKATAETGDTMKSLVRAFLSGYYSMLSRLYSGLSNYVVGLARGQAGSIPFSIVAQDNRAFFDKNGFRMA